MRNKFNIKPLSAVGEYKTGSLPSKITIEQIESVLGFPPNVEDDPRKVKYSWGFTVDGSICGIWDYKDQRWSVYDPCNVLKKVFAKYLK